MQNHTGSFGIKWNCAASCCTIHNQTIVRIIWDHATKCRRILGEIRGTDKYSITRGTDKYSIIRGTDKYTIIYGYTRDWKVDGRTKVKYSDKLICYVTKVHLGRLLQT